MSKVLVTESYLEDIADAIRSKNGSSDTYTPGQMAGAIEDIPTGGGITPTGTINISENGTYDVTQYASAAVEVSGGGGTVYAFVRCMYVAGNTVTATDGTTTLTGDTTGDYIFAIPNAGTWTFTSGTESKTLSINVYGSRLELSLRVVEIIQDQTEDENSLFVRSGNKLTVTWNPTLSAQSSHVCGFIVDTLGKACVVNRLSGNGSMQIGQCAKTAVLPNIVLSGTGRINYTGTVPATIQANSNYYVFVGVYNATQTETVFEITVGS